MEVVLVDVYSRFFSRHTFAFYIRIQHNFTFQYYKQFLVFPQGQPRGYPPMTNPMLFDDDPGIMSEVETSSTGFRRGGKQRSSLPVVRTPSKTLERPLGKKKFL